MSIIRAKSKKSKVTNKTFQDWERIRTKQDRARQVQYLQSFTTYLRLTVILM